MKKNEITTVILLTILSLFFMATVFSVFTNPTAGIDAYDAPEMMTFEYVQLETDVSGGNAVLQTASGTVSGGDTRVLYPAPEYDFKTDEITVHVKGLEREYAIAFVNDLHLITDHESGDVTEDNLQIAQNRYENLAVTAEGIHAEELWPEVVDYLNYYDFDAVIFGGDMLDYGSNSNILTLNEGMKRLKYPKDRIMYLRSDHDYGGWYGGSGFTDSDGIRLQTLILDGDQDEQCIEFDDFRIVGFNRSYKNISADAHLAIRQKLRQGKPIILATHVPFYSEVDDTLEEESMRVRSKIYYWSYDNGIYTPNQEMDKFLEEVYADDSDVVQIVAAHLHAKWDGAVTEHIREHIFAPTFEGAIGIIHVVGE